MRSIHYIYSCCLFSWMCTGLVSLSAAQSPSIDAISIASLPDRSDVALTTSPAAQSSSIDAIGIASLPSGSDVVLATSPSGQSSSIDAISIASLPNGSDVVLTTSPSGQSSLIDAISIASLPDRSDVVLSTSSVAQSSLIDAISIASLPDRSDVVLSTSSVAQSSLIDAIGIASLPDRSEVGATSPVMHPLDTAALDSEWQALIDQMHAVERIATFFVESRTFAFRKEPKLYRGVFRKEIDGRVSLAYSEPETVALHIGDGFAYYRKGEGQIRRIPDSNSQGGALAIFPQLLNFDLAALAQTYDISGAIENETWYLSCVAHADLQGDLPYQSMRVTGHGTAVMRIELTKSQKQGIVIEMGEPVYPEFYLPEIKAQYFFRPDLD